ncbi:hypothetical protein QR680_015246 [Steinernema hermaphroditum]|uniref:Uncharacterized protein n=1 Tax=Steinernema hermaphroditum TaxID=289476 RepID=A0AA39LKD8_9BILA|nr:hypothetical protein QR680_015246 [Steinernema hermaphroditum]
MLLSLALVEYFVILLLIIFSVYHLTIIYRNKSFKAQWIDSSPLALLFLSTSFMCLLAAIYTTQWILLACGAIRNVAENTTFLLYIGLLHITFQLCYITANLAIYAQRIYILAFPLNSLAKANKAIVLIEIVVSVVAVSVATVPNVVGREADTIPLPKDCYSNNCSNLLTRRTYSAGATFVLSVCTVILGGVLQYAHFKFRNSYKTAKSESVKLNQFARYSFYIRLSFETLPYMTDVILSNTVGLKVGPYLGPYGLLVISLDFCICTFLYHNMIIKKSGAVAQFRKRISGKQHKVADEPVDVTTL